MARSPDTRPLVRFLRPLAARYLRTALETRAAHLRVRIRDAARVAGIEVPPAVATDATGSEGAENRSTDVFQETESLSGVLQYRHGSYRTVWGGPGPFDRARLDDLRREYRDLYAHRMILGAHGDAARMVTGLPRSGDVFGPADLRRSLASLQLGALERLRVRARWFLDRRG